MTPFEKLLSLPVPFKLERRAYGAFAIELPTVWRGYLTCGRDLDEVVDHVVRSFRITESIRAEECAQMVAL